MAAYSFTTEQKDAIASWGENLLVAAGAGSGKTTVLVERIIHWLLEGGSIDRLLALTFTNAAAADMRFRIDQALSEVVEKQPDNAHLRRQIALAPLAGISTIHSFCLDLLRRYAYRLGLPSSFRIAGDLELRLLQSQVMEELLEEEYAREGSMLPALADAYGGNRDDSGLVTLLENVYAYSRSRPDPEAWLRACAEGFLPRASLDAYPFAVFLCRSMQNTLSRAAELLRQAMQNGSGIPHAWQGQTKNEMQALADLASADFGLEQLLNALPGIEFATLRSKRGATADENELGEVVNPYDEAAKDRFKKRRDHAKKEVATLRKRFCGRSRGQALAEIVALSPLMEAFVDLVLRYDMRLLEEKRRKGWIDFSDMEHLTLALLQEEDVREAVRDSYDEILVDEYQDINEVQEAILSYLARGDNLFAVGDVKQSIYRFRLAEPGLFLDKYHRYGAREFGRRIDLNRNYRSDQSIIHGVNYLFRQLMTGGITEICYDRAAELYAGQEAQGTPPECYLIDLDQQAPEELPLSSSNAEGRLLARKILALRKEGYALRDMAALLRSRSHMADLVGALTEAGIPTRTDDEADYCETPEIALLLSLLQIIDNPRQDLSLAAVLRSPMFAFSGDELVAIRLLEKEGDFYGALVKAAAGEDALSRKSGAFLAQLAIWREIAREKKITDLLRVLFRESGFYRLMGAMPGGMQRQANLRLLYSRAAEYERTAYAGLFRFLRMIEDGRNLGVREGSARLNAEAEDVVRVMTIHKSKGLEFPVVFVSGLNDQFNTMDELGDIIAHRELGLGARVADRSRHCKYASFSHFAVARKLHEEALAEELRILYVALTRPQKRLILTASVKKVEQTMENWADELSIAGSTLSTSAIAAARRPLDWLGPALLRHPDARELQEKIAHPLALLGDESAWLIRLLPASDFARPVEEETPAFPEVEAPLSPLLQEKVDAVLDYRYPYQEVCDYPSKWSVSDINRLVLADDDDPVSPLFREADWGRDAHDADCIMQRGSAYHRVMELLDLSRVDEAEIAAQVGEMTRQGRLTQEQAEAVDIPKIALFFTSDLGRAFAAAPKIARETSFTMAMAAQNGESILVQGTLDAAFWQPEGWVLLDYKTGGYGKSEREIVEHYRTQLDCYRQAIERLWQKPVSAVYLCMLDLSCNIKMPL